MRTSWNSDIELPVYPPLSGDVRTAVVVIGGGITGITTAYLLAKAGIKAIVIDRATLSGSGTAKTTAFLTNSIDTNPTDLEAIFGAHNASRILHAHDDAINDVETIVRSEGIECDFMRVPEFIFAAREQGLERLHQDMEVLKRYDFPVHAIVPRTLPFDHAGGYMIEARAKFHPLKHAARLRTIAEARGAEFYEHTDALDVAPGETITVTTKSGAIIADYCVIATDLPIKNPWRILWRKGEYLSYVLELDIIGEAPPEGLYEDDGLPYHYFRIDKGNGEIRMIIGGEDHRKSFPIDPAKNYNALETYLRERFPGMKYAIKRAWRGPIIETIDGLPFVGMPDRRHPNLFVATGFSGNGMTHSMIAGKIIAGAIAKTPDQYADLFDPYRNQFTFEGLWIKSRDYIGMAFGGWLKNLWKKPRGETVTLD